MILFLFYLKEAGSLKIDGDQAAKCDESINVFIPIQTPTKT